MAVSLGISRHLKVILLALSILLALPAIRDQLVSNIGLSVQVGYFGRLILLWAGLLTAAYIRNGTLRWMTALVLSLSACAMIAFERSTGQFLTYDTFITMLHSTDSNADALAQNQVAIIRAAWPALVLLFALGLKPTRQTPVMSDWAAAAAPWLATAALAGVLFVRGGDGGQGQPPSYTPIAYLALAGYEAATGEIGDRQSVRMPRLGGPRSRNIILVVDESIAGQYLDINSPDGVATPLSRTWPGIGIHNYGLAVAVSNCSSSSNVTLRYGGTRMDYRRIIATQPSVWAYAHRAGMQTIFIDAQGGKGELRNFMTEEERAEIDKLILFEDVSVEQRDMAVASELNRLMRDPRPKFILVNKVGAHFPIQAKYPDAYSRYSPAMARGGILDSILSGRQPGFNGSPSEWVRYRNSYRNTLLWTVGAFFEKLLRDGDFSETTMIYTSDHGQNLHEDGSSGLYTHCGPEPVSDEGVVPLVVLEGGKSRLDWQHDLAHNHDRSSHFMIFPTLLKLMGYDRTAAEAQYGNSLDALSSDPGTFNVLFNARLRREPVWLPVERARISHAATSDGPNAVLPSSRFLATGK